jgi:hypothetical protein
MDGPQKLMSMNKYQISIFINNRYLDKAINRIEEFTNIGIDNYCFYCLDHHTYSSLPTPKKELFLFDFSNFRQSLWYHRTIKIQQLINQTSIDILQADCDCIWYKNPSQIFDENQNIDLFFTCGINFPAKPFKKWGFVLRGGFYYIRSNEKTKLFIEDWITLIKQYNDDQIALNNLFLEKNIIWNFPSEEHMILLPFYKNPNRPFKFSKKPITGKYKDCNIMILPAYDFPRLKTKHTPFVLDLHAKHQLFGELD